MNEDSYTKTLDYDIEDKKGPQTCEVRRGRRPVR